MGQSLLLLIWLTRPAYPLPHSFFLPGSFDLSILYPTLARCPHSNRKTLADRALPSLLSSGHRLLPAHHILPLPRSSNRISAAHPQCPITRVRAVSVEEEVAGQDMSVDHPIPSGLLDGISYSYSSLFPSLICSYRPRANRNICLLMRNTDIPLNGRA